MSMRRWLILFFAVLLPLQFAWSAASAYCQHEITEEQSKHFGHHFHAHKGEVKKSSDSKLMADSDCAACHASAAASTPTRIVLPDFAVASIATRAMPSLPFSSALARAPDRPQWPRLV
jgi:hypothetical protein